MMGWSLTRDWMTLPPDEQAEWLAYDRHRQQTLTHWLHALNNSKFPDPAAYMQLILETM